MPVRARSLLPRRLLAAGALSALLLAGTAPAYATAAHHPSGPRTYVALGDSYAAGEGLAPYDPAAPSCDRSLTQNYPELLTREGPPQFNRLTDATCTGATTGSVVATQLGALDRRTRTVTLTVGGNDVGFGPVLVSCLYSPVPQVQQSLPGGAGCRAQDAAVDTAIDYLGGPAGGSGARLPLASVIAAVAQRAPRAEILVSGYPQLFGPTPTDCAVSSALPVYVSAPDVAWIREETTALDAAIRSGVARARAAGARARYVDATWTFAGHGLCDTGTSYINGLVLAPAATPTPLPASFHPTATGQYAYADAFALRGTRSGRY